MSSILIAILPLFSQYQDIFILHTIWLPFTTLIAFTNCCSLIFTLNKLISLIKSILQTSPKDSSQLVFQRTQLLAMKAATIKILLLIIFIFVPAIFIPAYFLLLDYFLIILLLVFNITSISLLRKI